MLILFLILLTSEMTHQVTLFSDESQCYLNKNLTSSFTNIGDKAQFWPEIENILNQSYTSDIANTTPQRQADKNLSPKNIHKHTSELYDLQLEIFYEHNIVIAIIVAFLLIFIFCFKYTRLFE